MRVVVLDRETGETFIRGHRRREPRRRSTSPGTTRTATRRSPTACSVTSSPRSTTQPTRTSTACRGTTRASPTCGARDRRSSRPGTSAPRPDHRRGRAARAGARRGVPRRGRRRALARGLGRARGRRRAGLSPDLVLHAAAWTRVDDAEGDPAGAAEVNVAGTRNAAQLGAPLVYYSTDYVFDGTKGEPYVESDRPHPHSVYGITKLEGEAAAGDAWIVRSSWLFGATGHNFVRTMLRLGAERDEVRVVDDQVRLARPTSAISPRRRARSSSCRAASGTWPRTASARGPSSRGRSSRRRGSNAASSRSRPPSSARRHHGRRTRCCAASALARRSFRTGARACASASSGSPGSAAQPGPACASTRSTGAGLAAATAETCSSARPSRRRARAP